MPTPNDLLSVQQVFGTPLGPHRTNAVGSPESQMPTFEWHHAMLALLELPADRRERVADQLAGLRSNKLASGLLYGYVNFQGFDEVQGGIYTSALWLTDEYSGKGGYVPKRAIQRDMEQRGIEFEDDILTKGSQIGSKSARIQARAMMTMRDGFLFSSGAMRLVDPARVISADKDTTLPEQIKPEPYAVQQAYRLFRLTAPMPDGRGRVAASELENLLRYTNTGLYQSEARYSGGATDPILRRDVQSSYRICRDAVVGLANNPLFQMSRTRGERWVGLRQSEIEARSRP